MRSQVIAGQVVTLLSYGDVLIQRKLVSVENGVHFVCKQEEFDLAVSQRREPVCIGFRPEYVMELRDDTL